MDINEPIPTEKKPINIPSSKVVTSSAKTSTNTTSKATNNNEKKSLTKHERTVYVSNIHSEVNWKQVKVFFTKKVIQGLPHG